MPHKDKRRFGFYIWLAGLIWLSAASPVITQSTIQAVPVTEPVVVENSTVSWPETLWRNPSLNLNYALAYDATHLYVLLEIPDTNLQNRILMTGLTIGFDIPHDKGYREIQYPQGMETDQRPEDPMMLPLFLEGLQNVKFRVLPGQAEKLPLTFYNKGEGRQPKETGNMQLTVYFDGEGIMLYTAAIPWAWLGRSSPPKKIDFSLETGELGRPIMSEATGMTGPMATAKQQEMQKFWDAYRAFTVAARLKRKVFFR